MMDFDFDFQEFFEEHRLLVVVAIIVIIGAAVFVMKGGHKTTKAPAQPVENYDYVASSLPYFMTIMSNIVNGNTVMMPLGATKIYAYGYIGTYVASGTSTNVIALNTVSVFMSGSPTPTDYILYVIQDKNGTTTMSQFHVNGTNFLYVDDGNNKKVYTGATISNLPIDVNELFNYTGANASIITVSGQTYLMVFKTNGDVIYNWFFGSNRIVYDVTRIQNGTTTETFLYIQVEAPNSMWASQKI